ncbi:hypothetical protein [Devosia sp.]|uniref:hypothetical protein n=1 Tax=Devosia sp. TaxID=1871048 RepID=UPI001AC1D3B4|nr:hypothetical protein [Devosia sp.]MBN9311106.1 hypothetical protein [Devosia sp.]
MSAYALVSVACPNCRGQFQERAKLLRSGGQAWCPHCEALFALDDTSEPIRRTLALARDARRRRRQRIAELRSGWSEEPEPAKPLLMSDVLRALDDLLVRMDALATRKG